jgi:hypothetical protein
MRREGVEKRALLLFPKASAADSVADSRNRPGNGKTKSKLERNAARALSAQRCVLE